MGPLGDIPFAQLRLRGGDAAQRAIVGWHLGWPRAQAAAGKDWMRAALEPLLDDPYAAVAYIARRAQRDLPTSTRRLKGGEDLSRDDRIINVAE